MEHVDFFNQYVTAYITYGKGLAITQGGIKLKKENILTIDSQSPLADIIADPLSVSLYNDYDFVVFPDGIKAFKDMVAIVKKAIKMVKPNGRVIFYCDKDTLIPAEFEGFMYLFFDSLAIEQRVVVQHDKYIMITRRIK